MSKSNLLSKSSAIAFSTYNESYYNSTLITLVNDVYQNRPVHIGEGCFDHISSPPGSSHVDTMAPATMSRP